MENTVSNNFQTGKKIVNALFYCTTEKEVETIFDRFSVTDPLDKVFFLRDCMQVEESFDLPSKEQLSSQEEYECELAIFLEGSWRLLTV